MRADQLTWPEYAAAISHMPVVLPVGAMDAHGPHLPIGTDTMLAEHMANVLAARREVLCLPALPYGRRTSTAQGGGRFPGAVDLCAETLLRVISDILSALYREGARRIVMINNHMCNLDTLHTAAANAALQEVDFRVMVVSWWQLVSEVRRDLIAQRTGVPRARDHHAGMVETSLMMAAYSKKVRQGQIADEPLRRTERYVIEPVPADMRTVAGCVFEASAASAEIGREILDEVMDALVDAVTREFE